MSKTEKKHTQKNDRKYKADCTSVYETTTVFYESHKVACTLFMTVSTMHVETSKMFKVFFLLSRVEVLIFHTQKNSFTGFCCIVLESCNCTFFKTSLAAHNSFKV